jgi:5'-nucleotidase
MLFNIAIFLVFMIVLADMDGVLAWFDLGVNLKLAEQYPQVNIVPLEKRSTFYIQYDYPAEQAPLIQSIYMAEGFYRSLPPVPGGREGIEEILGAGHDVRICTVPHPNHRYCLPEKYLWVEQNLGEKWLDRIIITRDKTLIRGHLLIDDNSEITGAAVPEWEHILYTQPYNLGVKGKRRLTWDNWRDVLVELRA